MSFVASSNDVWFILSLVIFRFSLMLFGLPGSCWYLLFDCVDFIDSPNHTLPLLCYFANILFYCLYEAGNENP